MLGRYIHDMFKKFPLISIIVSYMAIFLIAYILFGFITKGATVYDSLFRDRADIFMDYFNSVYYSIDGPYANHSVIYPPFITCIYGLIGMFISDGNVTNGFELRASYLGMFSYMLTVIISLVMLHHISDAYSKRKCMLIKITTILIVLSYPVLFTIMRGNCILYSVLFVMLFLLGYRSNNTKIRFLSYICLGIAAGIKIYVVLFGILVLKERNIKDIALCVTTGLAILFVPFLFTDGNISVFFTNAFGYSLGSATDRIININSIFSFLSNYGLNDTIANMLSIVLVLITYLLSLILIVMNKNVKEWEAVTILSTNIIIGFGPSVAYLFVFMIPAILMFMNEESERSDRNYSIAVLLALTLAVFPGIGAFGGSAYFITIKGLSTMAIYVILVASIIKHHGLIDKCDKKFVWDSTNC